MSATRMIPARVPGGLLAHVIRPIVRPTPHCPCCSPKAGPWASSSSLRCRTPARTCCPSGTCSRPASPSLWSSPNRPTSCSAGAHDCAALTAGVFPLTTPGVGYVWCDGVRRTHTGPRRLGDRRRHRCDGRRLRARHPCGHHRRARRPGGHRPHRQGAPAVNRPAAIGASCMNTRGLLHVLAGLPLAGSGAGSRPEEAKKSRRRVQDPAAPLGLLRRGLDAAPDPATLSGRREGARPPRTAAA